VYIEQQEDSDVKILGGGDAEKPPDGLWPLLVLSLVYLHCNTCGFVVPALLPQASSHTPYHSHVTVRRVSTQRPVTPGIHLERARWVCLCRHRGREATHTPGPDRKHQRRAHGWRQKP